MLTTRSRDLHPRHRSLRNTIDWSYDLLTRQEQRLFYALSCFVDGFTSEAVASVCAPVMDFPSEGATLPAQIAHVNEALQALCSRSLVRRSIASDTQAARFSLLESLREYGLERLEDDSALRDILRERHKNYFLEFTERQAPLLAGSGQSEAVEALGREAANIRVARELTLSQNGPQNAAFAAQFGVALRRFWSIRGWLREGQGYFDRVIARENEIADPALRAKLLIDAGLLGWSGPRAKQAIAYFERCVALCREFQFDGAKEAEAKALNGLGMVAYGQGDLDKADSYYEQSLALRRTLGDTQGLAGLLTNMGIQSLERGDYEQAMNRFQEALPLREAKGDKEMVANLWNCVGAAAEGAGDLTKAQTAFSTSREAFERLGADVQAAMASLNLASVAIAAEQWSEAKLRYEEALAVLKPQQDFRGVPECLYGLGRVALAQGDTQTAQRLCGEALDTYRQAQDRKGLPVALEHLAEVAEACGETGLALRFVGAAQRLRLTNGTPRRWQQESRMKALTARLGDSPVPDVSDVETILDEAVQFGAGSSAT